MSAISQILGFKYTTWVEEGGVKRTEINIFVPSYQLNISDRGYVHTAFEALRSLAAEEARKSTLARINSQQDRVDSVVEEAMKAADRLSQTRIEISATLLDTIKDLYEKSIAERTPIQEARAFTQQVAEIVLRSGFFITEASGSVP